MQKPELEIVRFGSDDVIATSGGALANGYNWGTGAMRPEYIIAMTDEVNEDGDSNRQTHGKDWTIVDSIYGYFGEYNKPEFGLSTAEVQENSIYQDAGYVWFSGGQWRTEGKRWNEYNNGFPT